MRHLFAFVLLLAALGAVRLVGCGDEFECSTDADCDDQNECTDDFCSAGSCSSRPLSYADCDDGDDSECTTGRCNDMGVCTTGTGWEFWERDTPCESDGIPGVCLCGACVTEPECSTNADCDDGNECTYDFCDLCGLCDSQASHECEPCKFDGVAGLCIDGVCRKPECSTNADWVCDDGIACTDDVCDPCYGCQHPVNCDDGDVCTQDICDRVSGECSYPAGPDGTYCGWHYEWGYCSECGPFFPCYCIVDDHCRNGECV